MTDKSLILSISEILKKNSKNIYTSENRLILQKGLILNKYLNNKKNNKKTILKREPLLINEPLSINNNHNSLHNNINYDSTNNNIVSLKLSNLSVSDNALLEHIEILKNQLELAGIKPIEDIISYEDAKKKLKQALISLSKNDSFENNSEFERWDTFVTNHPNFIIEKKEEDEKWKEEQKDSINESFNIQYNIIPKDIANLSILDLKKNMNTSLANRIFRNKSLWLVHSTKDEISKLHFADLQYKYNNIGLDIVEMKALYACLPEKFLFDHNKKKEQWKKNILERLKELTNQEKTNTLSKKYIRNYCYLQQVSKTKDYMKKKMVNNKSIKTDLFAELSKFKFST